MVKNSIISASKANQLYWLGRYQERVYMTLHLMRKCYDQMIDGNPESYHTLREMLDPMHNYPNNEEFALGMRQTLQACSQPSTVLWTMPFSFARTYTQRRYHT